MVLTNVRHIGFSNEMFTHPQNPEHNIMWNIFVVANKNNNQVLKVTNPLGAILFLPQQFPPRERYEENRAFWCIKWPNQWWPMRILPHVSLPCSPKVLMLHYFSCSKVCPNKNLRPFLGMQVCSISHLAH